MAVMQAWKKTKQSSSLLQLQSGSAQLTLTFKPLRVDLSIAGSPAASFNARQMFNYEYLRQKQVKIAPQQPSVLHDSELCN